MCHFILCLNMHENKIQLPNSWTTRNIKGTFLLPLSITQQDFVFRLSYGVWPMSLLNCSVLCLFPGVVFLRRQLLVAFPPIWSWAFPSTVNGERDSLLIWKVVDLGHLLVVKTSCFIMPLCFLEGWQVLLLLY